MSTTERSIIDTHQHVFWHGRDDRGLIADMDQQRIERAWLLTWEIAPDEDAKHYHKVLNPAKIRSDGTHPGILLDDLLKARDRYPERFDLGYCPHPLHPQAPALLESAHRMYGVRVCGEWKFRTLFDDPRSLELFHQAGALKMPVVLHLDIPYLYKDGQRVYDPLWYGGTVENLERALIACPETIFIGHAPGFWREISGDAAADASNYPTGPVAPGGKLYGLFERYPNLYADMSAGSGLRALSRDPEHAIKFINQWQDRLLFARDYYGPDLQDFLATLPLADQVKAKIFRENALKLVPVEA